MARDLSNVVFDTVFPALVAALARQSTGELPEIRDAALIFLYRLLFVLYAEDRGLLPLMTRAMTTTPAPGGCATTWRGERKTAIRSPPTPPATTTT